VLFVEFAQEGPGRPAYTLLARALDVGGSFVDTLRLLEAGAAAAWDGLREPDEAPMPLVAAEVGDVLAELASLLRSSDMIWPRPQDDGFVESRALAWARCRAYLPPWPDEQPTGDEERDVLVEAFLREASVPDEGLPDAEAVASLAHVFLDYGDGYLHARPLGWSPTAVMVFLVDWLPRKVALDAEQRVALPEALRRWLRFALARRGVAPEWIEPVVAEVDEHLEEFEEAFDDEASWGPAKQIVAELERRGVDLTDRESVDRGIRQLNAESLATRLIDPSTSAP
jgi:hypothetical protein